jgi:hypothetical protein
MTNQDGPQNLRDEYRRLLRWYPLQWRRRNEEIMIGTLLDQAQEAGREHPNSDDRRSLMLGGLRARAVGSGKRSLVGTGALGIGVVFSLIYLSLISWDPAHHFLGYVGPFTNPSVITGALLTASFLLSLFRMNGVSNLLALTSAASSALIGLLAWQNGWLGPGPPAVVLFAGFALVGVSGANGIFRAIRLLVSVLCASLSANFILDLVSPGVGEKAMMGGIAAAALTAAVLLAWPWKSRRSRVQSASRRI